MAAKVVLRRELPAYHLLGAVGEAENADAVLGALEDGEALVAKAAAAALARLERRLDRRLGR